jgi:hypothetical protein
MSSSNTDRAAVISAINSTRNLNEAARKLGASRRTLQNRMREYGLPRGKAGRPKEWLPYKRSSSSTVMTVVGVGAVIASVIMLRRWLATSDRVAGIVDESPFASLTQGSR